jgi:hypothetical protein
MKIEDYRVTMSNDVLHSWAKDAQNELDQLRKKLEVATEALEDIAFSDELAQNIAQDALDNIR